MRTTGMAITASMVLLVILPAGSIWTFIDIPSIMMVVGMTIGLTLLKYKLEGLVFFKNEDLSRKSEMASWIGKTCLHVGLFSALVGFIQIASSLTDPAILGQAFAVAILPIFYSYLIYFFLISPFISEDQIKKALA